MKVTTPTWSHGATIDFKAPNRKVDTVFVHCSASDKANHDDVSVMRNWHVNGNGWNDVGYHYFITKAGDIQTGRPVEKTPAAQKGYNTGTIAICLHGLKEELFTQKQFESLIAFCKSIGAAYPDKKIRFRGHREVANKACPVFKYKVVLGLDSSGYMTGSTSTAPITASPGEPPPRADKTTQILDKGKPVLILQSVLVLLGADLKIDGLMGQNTSGALRDFQKKRSLHTENGLDDKTRAALIKALGEEATTLKKPDKGNKVKALQQLLKLAGSNKLVVDGDFGNKTQTAVEEFQTRKQINATSKGAADAKTQQALARELWK
ncbi:MAG: N-acetylmuramoyl-L-alanine amidase [Candidatus Competibacteraceae bacterium]|nr:N-acetylmuramoyl-L-alanine amidase [Candidatus Competibacteraceae bacterium]HRY16117.1 N-acetylmuramoyl-L-alanine amidase [Candidatus Competibacteraceae bacterium]